MNKILIKSATVVNEGRQQVLDVMISDGRIEEIAPQIDRPADREIRAEGLHLLPGLIDDQVHFREPGLIHKANIWHESRAAVAGGTTSFMEMPNTVPNTLTQELLEDKYMLASRSSLANYSFYMGASNSNLDEVLRTNSEEVCGIKVFMGSSTGNMLVDDERTLEGIFSSTPMLVATHCEDEATIRRNTEAFIAQYGEAGLTAQHHHLIRSAEACYLSSSKAVELARKHGTRLHVLHISTAREVELFEPAVVGGPAGAGSGAAGSPAGTVSAAADARGSAAVTARPLEQKLITAEACVHHLWFSAEDYVEKGNLIKWNPAVKTAADRAGILAGLLDGRIDVIATDHAPHTWEEKGQPYLQAPSGGPLIQFALQALLELHARGQITLEQLVQKTAHNTAICFGVQDRGFIREGYWADLVLVDLQRPYTVRREHILSKCGWSPFEGHTFPASITHTLVSGRLAFEQGQIQEVGQGQRLKFRRRG